MMRIWFILSFSIVLPFRIFKKENIDSLMYDWHKLKSGKAYFRKEKW